MKGEKVEAVAGQAEYNQNTALKMTDKSNFFMAVIIQIC